VRIVSDPPGAFVELVDTHEHIGQTPDHPVVTKRFRLFERRRVEYRLRFYRRGQCDTIEYVVIDPQKWYRTRLSAENGDRFTSVSAVLQPIACDCRR
jgi:hypothetical protein